MTYSTLLQSEGINSQYLIILVPRREVTGFSLLSGSVYQKSFDYGTVVSVTQDGTELTQGFSSSLSAGQFYFDTTLNTLYVRMSDSSNPSSKTVIASYEMYFGTFDAHWYRVPTDNTTLTVYYEPMVKQSPSIKATISNVLFGYIPIQSSSLQLSNATDLFEKHVYDSSFNKADVKIYHWLDELTVANVTLLYKGLCGDVSYQDDTVTISVVDRIDIFNKEYRHATGDSFFGTTTFPSLNPQFIAKPIRQVYGVVDGFIPVNVDYIDDSPTTSDNRDWVCINGQTNIANVSRTVAASPASTTTRTYLNSANGFRVDDAVWFDRAVGTDEYHFVTLVNYGSNYIEHTALATPMASGDTVKRSFVGNVTVVQDGVKYFPMYNRDYTENLALAGTTSGFSFTTTMEANLSIPNTLSPSDMVYARVYGHKNTVTLGGPAFGSDNSDTNSLAHPIVILFDLLKKLGLAESEINTSSFSTIQGLVSSSVGFAIPKTSFDKFPSYKDLVNDLLITEALKLYLDNSGDWKISQIAPLGSSSKSIDDTEILVKSIEYKLSYQDIKSDVTVEYGFREVSDTNENENQLFQVSAENLTASYLHKVDKQETFTSLHYKSTEAQELCDHISFIFGDRSGVLTLQTKNRFFDTLLSDVVTVSRTRLPGFDFDTDTEQTRDFAVVELNKNLKAVTLQIDDQKGIEDNSGSW